MITQEELDGVMQFARQQEARQREARVAELPRVALAEKHMRNCQLLLNRARLLERLPRWATVAELGVDQGRFSEQILKIAQPGTLHLVDLWGSDRYHGGLYESALQRFAPEIDAGRVHIHRKSSLDAADEFADGHFDWVYVDTDHSYQTTALELRRYAAKVKPEGLIAGHDYCMGNWVSSYRYGVIEAVHEFCVDENWELVYLTLDPLESQSFAIRRIL
ncbi:class I SAM-dependent methyltransferase [Piscinibacter sakaiensis]|uniref:Tetratricopeptide repeat family protein n=1 Tax=Piscinibacter sakaiensis TaxID=1547922 RepID=A0A0K8P6I4_PISS1|nr:class I SAM-dependent methyltransferase [Piscinibacter sakaiensis]GAP38211.1 tetratricopeptide repeat family protein [Piscinibacter sakaiensis]